MTAIITFANQKGGVGKTTCTINVAAAFALKLTWQSPDKPGRVLVIDMDSQCNTVVTFSTGVFGTRDFEVPDQALEDYLLQRTAAPLWDAIVTSEIPTNANRNLDFIFSTRGGMKQVEKDFSRQRLVDDSYIAASEDLHFLTGNSSLADGGKDEVVYRLADMLAEVSSHYELIFIDTGPKESMLTTAAFAAATHLIVPLEMQGYSSLGFEDNLDLVREVQRNWNPHIQLIGILPMRVVPNSVTHTDMIRMYEEKYPGLTLPPIAHRMSVQDSANAGLDVFSYKPPRRVGSLVSSDPATIEFAKVVARISSVLKL
jgi:chromosome partitioning protein